MRLCGFLLLLLLGALITACVSDTSMNDAEKKRIVEKVKTVVQNEFDLVYFNKTYAQYDEAINEIVGEEYRAALSDEVVFGYNNEAYTREDMANMPAEVYDRHKEYMLRLIRDTGLDNVRIVVKLSDVYEGNPSFVGETRRQMARDACGTRYRYPWFRRHGRRNRRRNQGAQISTS
jgi:hypothetical protein